MKSKLWLAALAVAIGTNPTSALADDGHDQMVKHGAQVMPFDQGQATHMFLPSATGGVIEIVVRNLDARQLELVRSHLSNEAGRFARGDYSDPAYIHGASMPGLSRLQASASRVTVRYFETPTGAAITFSSADAAMVGALHEWLAAQQRDHNGSGMNHCDTNRPM